MNLIEKPNSSLFTDLSLVLRYMRYKSSKVLKTTTRTRLYTGFTHDVTAIILVFQNNETAAILVFQSNPVWVVELFSDVKRSLLFQ